MRDDDGDSLHDWFEIINFGGSITNQTGTDDGTEVAQSSDPGDGGQPPATTPPKQFRAKQSLYFDIVYYIKEVIIGYFLAELYSILYQNMCVIRIFFRVGSPQAAPIGAPLPATNYLRLCGVPVYFLNL